MSSRRSALNPKDAYDSDDILKAKLKPEYQFEFKHRPAGNGMYVYVNSREGGIFVVDKNVKLLYNIGQQYEQNPKRLKIAYSLGNDHVQGFTWTSRYLWDFERAMKDYIVNAASKKQMFTKAVDVDSGNIPSNMFASCIPHLTSKGELNGRNKKGELYPAQIKGIKLDTVKKPIVTDKKDGNGNSIINWEDSDDPVINVIAINSLGGSTRKGCKIINMDLYGNIQKADNEYGKESEEYAKAINDWKEFCNITWTYDSINENIPSGSTFKTIGFKIQGCFITNLGIVAPTLVCKYIYYSDIRQDDYYDPHKLNIPDIPEMNKYKPDLKKIHEESLQKEKKGAPVIQNPEKFSVPQQMSTYYENEFKEQKNLHNKDEV
jgi:hypothetical protein